MAACGNCGTEEIVIRIDTGELNANGDPIYTYPPVIGNILTIPADPGETVFNGFPGNGITITPGGTNGHNPTIAVAIGEGISVDGDGNLTVDTTDISPAWTTSNSTQPIQGVVVFPGGVDGHAPTFALAIHPDSEGVTFDGGQLLVECCPDTVWQAQTSTDGISIAPGDNPTGDAGNGHRPSFGLKVDGTTVGFDIDGNLTVLDASSCVIEADAGSLPWDATNPTWIDPAGVDLWCELRLSNGVTGSELWRNLADTNGVLSWHQVA